jgi:glutaredoxin
MNLNGIAVGTGMGNKTLIGVYRADGGLAGELSYFFGHLFGVRECNLCDITHSPIRKKSEFKAFEKRLLEEFGIVFKLVHMNERSDREQAASEGREPCVLLEHDDGSLSMFLDFVELKALGGSVKSFEKLVRTRLDFFV